MDVTRSTFSGNTAGVAGGAISTDDFGTNLRITNSTFSSNSAVNAGGATYSRLGRVTVTNSTFSGNSASTGGAVNHIGESTSSRLNVTNSTFSGNSAVDGGAMYSIDGTLMATNSTFFGNSATNTGSSIFSDALDATVARMFLAGNIFAGGVSGDNCLNVGTFNDRGYNLSDDGSCALTARVR